MEEAEGNVGPSCGGPVTIRQHTEEYDVGKTQGKSCPEGDPPYSMPPIEVWREGEGEERLKSQTQISTQEAKKYLNKQPNYFY
eukprot:scaffold2869_cov145-Skeletonema_menzelii.AAC.3